MAAASALDIDNEGYVEQLKPEIPADIEFGRRLGKGGFGQVHLVEGVDGVAVKRIRRDPDETWEEKVEEARKEFNVLRRLNSEYFVSVYELRVRAEPEQLLIFMEYMPGGTLHQLIKDSPNRRLVEVDVKMFARQLLYAIQHMHKNNVMNRDLKPENILLDATKRHLKICDFGLAAELSSSRAHTALSTDCGTSRYMAPEIQRGEYGTKSELWSLGIILVEMNTGQTNAVNLDNLLRDVSGQMKDLISKLLVYDPKDRLTAARALQHALFQNRYISQAYAGKELTCFDDDLDGIIKTALDNKLPIYAVVAESEYVGGEYNNTGIYYIPDLEKIIVVNDKRLSKLLFPVTTSISGKEIIVGKSAINSLITMAKRGDYFPRLLWTVHIIVSHSSAELPGHDDYGVTNRDGKVEINHLYFYIKDEFDSSTLSTIVKYMAANVNVVSTLFLSSSPSQPISNLCEAIRDMDAGLRELKLSSIDMSGEQRLADTLKGMKWLKGLILTNTDISADALVQIGHNLKHKLQLLNIHNEPCLQSPDTCGRFFNAIKQSSTIYGLRLTDNKLNGSHLSALPDILPTMNGLFDLLLDDFKGSEEFMQQLTQAVGRKIAGKVHIRF